MKITGLLERNKDEKHMTQRRVTETNQISTVIDVLQLGKKSGILTVERGERKDLEEGTMTIVKGKVVQASLGKLQGRDAIARLFSWQACRFSFAAMVPEQMNYARQYTPPPQSNKPDSSPQQKNTTGIQAINQKHKEDWNLRPSLSLHRMETMEETLRILERQGFSRAHRRLIMLIDGKRTIRDLSTLISRTPGETMAMITTLQQASFIQL